MTYGQTVKLLAALPKDMLCNVANRTFPVSVTVAENLAHCSRYVEDAPHTIDLDDGGGFTHVTGIIIDFDNNCAYWQLDIMRTYNNKV